MIPQALPFQYHSAMPDVHRFALVPYSPQQMFDLVQNVTAYPQFLSWVERAAVHEQTDRLQKATLGLNLAGLRPEFTTANELNSPSAVAMTLLEGPFKALAGQWRFEPLGFGTKVSLDLHFEINTGLLSSALSRSFGKVADRMVDDFSRRAIEVYGDED